MIGQVQFVQKMLDSVTSFEPPKRAAGSPKKEVDLVELSRDGLALNKGTAAERAAPLYSELLEKLGPLAQMVKDLLGEQNASIDELSSKTEEIQSEAQELLDGYFSAENTAARIFDFSFSFYDGTEDRTAFADRMRGYIDEGFAQAEKAWGGRLEDVSYETRDLIAGKIQAFIDVGKPQDSGEQNAKADKIDVAA